MRRETQGRGLCSGIKMAAHLVCGGSICVSPFHQAGERDCTGLARSAWGLWVQFSWQEGAFECFMSRDEAGTKQCFRKINLELHDRLIDSTTISSVEKEGISWTKLVYCIVCFSFKLAYVLMELFFKG